MTMQTLPNSYLSLVDIVWGVDKKAASTLFYKLPNRGDFKTYWVIDTVSKYLFRNCVCGDRCYWGNIFCQVYKAKGQHPPYLVRHCASGIVVGDKVRVTRKAASYEDGWGSFWVPSMDEDVGKEFVVQEDCGSCGFELGRYCNFPYFILEKV